jgi:hypothetical protein
MPYPHLSAKDANVREYFPLFPFSPSFASIRGLHFPGAVFMAALMGISGETWINVDFFTNMIYTTNIYQ